ncbi:fused MFS/spermidine synthase [Paeniglutamicibacter antarcticus]|uniref:Fused MFS/spermidine synthase n=1 Tax=Arthrobacter terrae TaxID=2935737 RepID=A0A931CQI7_9MICC|nr:fused MFS/spermidine synthase [Arthrobacter terrae]MBG0739149.1 fused MFS/spermidine synthase [Arthrobacter terrae]
MAGNSRYLRTTGQHATIAPDGWTDGAFVLSIAGAEQSHVNLARPEEIFYEYLRRIAHVVDLVAPGGRPISALHLGAGALTLARYIQRTRPGSVQHAVELERELLDYVLQQLPLPAGSILTTHIGDAREVLNQLEPDLSFDVIVLDIFSGPEAPEHIACTGFYQEAIARLAPAGVLVVNVGDEPALTLVRSQVRALRRAIADRRTGIPASSGAPAAPGAPESPIVLDAGVIQASGWANFGGGEVAAVAETGMFAGRYPGNIILIGTTGRWPSTWTAELTARGPHPATVLTGVDLDSIAGGAPFNG